jgi:hypothetical protein
MSIDSLICTRTGEQYCSGHSMILWCRQIAGVFLAVSLVLLLVACSSGSASPQTSSSSTKQTPPTPTTLPSGTLLYQSDWSHGLADWHASPGWKLTHGFLQSDTSSDSSLTSPYMPVVPNYAIEVRFQIVSVPVNGGYFVVTADRARGKDGYLAGIANFLKPGPHSEFANPAVQSYIIPIDSMDSSMVTSDYEPGFVVRTYRIEVQGAQVRFFIDDLRKSFASSSQTSILSNGPIRLKTAKVIVRVFSVRMTAL